MIAQILLIAAAIMSIEGNILAAAFTAAVSMDFGYHCFWSKKLVQNIFRKHTQNYIFLYHYRKLLLYDTIDFKTTHNNLLGANRSILLVIRGISNMDTF